MKNIYQFNFALNSGISKSLKIFLLLVLLLERNITDLHSSSSCPLLESTPASRPRNEQKRARNLIYKNQILQRAGRSFKLHRIVKGVVKKNSRVHFVDHQQRRRRRSTYTIFNWLQFYLCRLRGSHIDFNVKNSKCSTTSLRVTPVARDFLIILESRYLLTVEINSFRLFIFRINTTV
jgi:hypothetical protein